MNQQSFPRSIPPEYAKPAGKRRLRLWFIIGLALLLTLLVPIFIVGGVLYWTFTSVRSSEPFQTSVEMARENPEVIAALGTPITPSWLFSGQVNFQGRSGTADLEIQIRGPSGSATIYVQASKSSGAWSYYRMDCQLHEDGRVIPLLGVSPEPPDFVLSESIAIPVFSSGQRRIVHWPLDP